MRKRDKYVIRANKYVITGTKSWISGARVADFFVVAAKTNWKVPGARDRASSSSTETPRG